MCTKVQLHAILSAIYQKAVTEFGDKLDAVILYGSYARGDYDEESDIDVMVRVKLPKTELEKYRKMFSHLGSDLGLSQTVYVAIHLQDFETFDRFRDDLPFYANVDREGVRIGA